MLLRRVLVLASIAMLVPAVAFAQAAVGGNVDPNGIVTRVLGVLQGPMGFGICLIGLIAAAAGAVFGHNHRGLYGVGVLIFTIFCGGWLLNTIVGTA